MSPFRVGRGRGMRRRTPLKARLLIAAVLAVVALMSYYSSMDENPITGERQPVGMNEKQEIAMGLQALPQMVNQHGGLYASEQAQQRLDQIGTRLLAALDKKLAKENRQNPYPFEFHLLADDQMINAFALPGGQVFVTHALYRQLTTEGQVAGVVGHEIGHVLARHGAERLAKQKLTEGLSGAVGVAGGDMQSAQMARAIGQMINMKYGRDDELESDRWGVRLMADAGYDPRSMIDVMKVLDRASQGGGQPEFLSTHPKPANRIEYITVVIREVFPNGVSGNLEP